MSSTTYSGAAPEEHQGSARLAVLLQQSSLGDKAAFAALYAETAPRTFGLALRVLGDRGRAEDAIQEAYLKIWNTAERFDARKGNCQGWIFMIVHRVAVDHVRANRARFAREERHHRETFFTDPGGDPTHELANASLEATEAREAVARLSFVQRQALELAYFDGRTYSEVAGMLDVPLGTVKARIRDGLTRLRDTLSEPADHQVAT